MTPCAAIGRSIARRASYGVSPSLPSLCRHVPIKMRPGLSPVSPLSPLQHLSQSTSLGSSSSCKKKGLCCNTATTLFSSAQHTGDSWTASAPTGKPCCCTYKPTTKVKTMALVGRRDGRNFGYGRQLSYAGRQALEDLFAGGHFATVKAHSDRWHAFVRWCRSEGGPGYNDARQIDQETLHEYAAYLRDQIHRGEICIATAQNRLSSVNRTLAALRGDKVLRLANPSMAIGQERSNVRVRIPDGQDYASISRIVTVLVEQRYERVGAIILLARSLGMRLREAVLADLPRLMREAERFGCINIQEGTKGGRSGALAPRWVEMTARAKAALNFASLVSPAGSRNLLTRRESYVSFLNNPIRHARRVMQEQGLKGFHELRASYACERYSSLTGHSPPVHGGHCYHTDRKLDRMARLQISYELGHSRIDVASAYIGGCQ